MQHRLTPYLFHQGKRTPLAVSLTFDHAWLSPLVK